MEHHEGKVFRKLYFSMCVTVYRAGTVCFFPNYLICSSLPFYRPPPAHLHLGFLTVRYTTLLAELTLVQLQGEVNQIRVRGSQFKKYSNRC